MEYFIVETPEVSLTWIGAVRPADPGFTWLCLPTGRPLLRVRSECVKPTTRAETAKRILAERAKASLN